MDCPVNGGSDEFHDGREPPAWGDPSEVSETSRGLKGKQRGRKWGQKRRVQSLEKGRRSLQREDVVKSCNGCRARRGREQGAGPGLTTRGLPVAEGPPSAKAVSRAARARGCASGRGGRARPQRDSPACGLQ